MPLVFLDIEASSLAPDSYPLEIGWVGEDGPGESHLIQPEAGWTDWDPNAEAIHGISRAQLLAEGQPAELVAARVVAALAGHQAVSDAPGWDRIGLASCWPPASGTCGCRRSAMSGRPTAPPAGR